jgi:hypothetical protein
MHKQTRNWVDKLMTIQYLRKKQCRLTYAVKHFATVFVKYVKMFLKRVPTWTYGNPDVFLIFLVWELAGKVRVPYLTENLDT